ncbi:hypothetical protein ACLB1E_06640 [Escherichia coli]
MQTGDLSGTLICITNGHIDIVTRAARKCSITLFWRFAVSPSKLMFTLEERVELAQQATAHLERGSGRV